MRAEDTYISYAAAMSLLVRAGFSEGQARIILSHSHGKRIDGHDYFPLNYISQRAAEMAARIDEEDDA
jgi:hypothetical protein